MYVRLYVAYRVDSDKPTHHVKRPICVHGVVGQCLQLVRSFHYALQVGRLSFYRPITLQFTLMLLFPVEGRRDELKQGLHDFVDYRRKYELIAFCTIFRESRFASCYVGVVVVGWEELH